MPLKQSFQGQQPPLGLHFYQEQQLFQGGRYFRGNYLANYQTYVPNYQPGYGPSYAAQPSMGAPYPGVNTVWNPTINQQNLKPNVQIPCNQLGQPTGYSKI